MKQPGTCKNWGGSRPNSGRNPADLSEAEVKQLIKEFKKLAKETGKPIGRLLAEVAYGEEHPVRVRLKAIDLYYTYMVAKRSHKTIEEHKFQGPLIGLPPIMKMPPRPSEKQERFEDDLH